MKTRYLTRHVLTLLTLGAVGMGPSCAERTVEQLYEFLRTVPTADQIDQNNRDAAITELPTAIAKQDGHILKPSQVASFHKLLNERADSFVGTDLRKWIDKYTPQSAPEATIPSPATASGAQNSSKWGNAGLKDGWQLKTKEQVQGSYSSSQSPSGREKFLNDVKNPPALKPLAK